MIVLGSMKPPWAKQFKIICYQDGFHSSIPHGVFQDWLGEESNTRTFYISKASGLGVGSIVKYDAGIQSLRVGRLSLAVYGLNFCSTANMI